MDTNIGKLIELRNRLYSLAVFRDILSDPVVSALLEYLSALESGSDASGRNAAAILSYSEFVFRLYSANQGNLSEYIETITYNSENVFVRTIGAGRDPSAVVSNCVKRELETLGDAAQLTPERLSENLGIEGLPGFYSESINLPAKYDHRIKNISKYGYGKYAHNRMFYIEGNSIIPVRNPDDISLDELVDYEIQRSRILENTRALLNGKPAANILLTGDAGTGKSSTIKAVVNELYKEGLRIIEVRKDQLSAIQKLLDELADNPLKFILFIDDLSFLSDDDDFNGLKAVLEGSVSARSRNVVVYATSNRRHIVKERFDDREGDEVHRNDAMQEMISLSDRFGLHISFHKPDKKTYLNIVHKLAEQFYIDTPSEELDMLAERFALERGGRSARLARQFIDSLIVSK